MFLELVTLILATSSYFVNIGTHFYHLMMDLHLVNKKLKQFLTDRSSTSHKIVHAQIDHQWEELFRRATQQSHRGLWRVRFDWNIRNVETKKGQLGHRDQAKVAGVGLLSQRDAGDWGDPQRDRRNPTRTTNCLAGRKHGGKNLPGT